MGYTTDFDGRIEVSPPLNTAEIKYLAKFARTRRMERKSGPYFVDGSGDYGQGRDADIIEFNRPDASQPGLWCKWVPTEDGSALEWDGREKFYNSEEWMTYIIGHFLKSGAHAYSASDPQFNEFTFNHVCEGTIYAQGEDPDDIWRLVVKDNVVSVQQPTVVWPED